MKIQTGVVDEPIKSGEKDFLGLDIHSKSLIKFIERTKTPMTVGVQGEWGSGKTSLMRAIEHHFDEQTDDTLQIWINTWEFSLLSTPEETLIKIVSKIINDILAADKNKNRSNTIRENSKKIFKTALRVTSSFAGEVGNKLTDGIFEDVETISSLKEKLNEVIIDITTLKTNPYKKIIIYVDDLDRIVPENAVAILELLKNIFSLEKCIFILAIDYQVVVKGLREKFGEPNSENEWEFRAFFDKLIQLPFLMPINQYDIGNYVIELLNDINFTKDENFNPTELSQIVLLTIGGNPRSIKRLINSLSLIEIFTETKIETNVQSSDIDVEKFLLFSLLCLQIAYPYIYELINQNPGFIDWDINFAKNITREEESEEGFTEAFESLKQWNEDITDEEWEFVLFKICFNNKRLRSRFENIANVLDIIRKRVGDDSKIENSLQKILALTSVTSINTPENSDKSDAKARQELIGGFDEWCVIKNIDNAADKKELENFIKFLEEYGLLRAKFTRSVISFRNEGKGKKRNIIYLSKRKNGFNLGFSTAVDAESFMKEVEAAFSKFSPIFKDNKIENKYRIDFQIIISNFKDEERTNLIYYINKYRDEFYKE